MDEACLADLGYSRALLEDGVRAWPWRLAEDTMAELGRLKFSAGVRHSYGARTSEAPVTYSGEPPRDAIRAAARLGLGRALQLLR